MYEHVKTSCKHIPPSEQPRQFQSGYYLNKSRIVIFDCYTPHTGEMIANSKLFFAEDMLNSTQILIKLYACQCLPFPSPLSEFHGIERFVTIFKTTHHFYQP